MIASTADAGGSAFVQVDVNTGRVTDLGAWESLLYVLQRSPARDVVALDYEDVTSDNGWDLALVDGQGQGIARISMGDGDAWLPAWSPDGKQLAFLEEVSQPKPK